MKVTSCEASFQFNVTIIYIINCLVAKVFFIQQFEIRSFFNGEHNWSKWLSLENHLKMFDCKNKKENCMREKQIWLRATEDVVQNEGPAEEPYSFTTPNPW